MAEFSKLYLTKRGQSLVAKIMAGATNIQFTKVSTSSHVYAEGALENLTALEGVQQTNNVTKVTISNNVSVRVETAFTNEKLTAGYYLRSLGLYAKDPDIGEILYAVCVETSGLCYMPAYNGVTVSSAYIQLYTTVGNADNVNLSVYSGAYATVEDIQAMEKEIADLRAYVGYTENDIYGVEVDFVNKKFTRLAGAVNMAGGTPFDKVNAMGGRKRCNLTNDGVVVAYQGDAAFTSSGALTQAVSIGDTLYDIGTPVQVMVEQPKFYYKTVPMMLEEYQDKNGVKAHKTRKMRYYISDTPKVGFKVHPQFISNGKENDFIYKSAYDGSLWDASASAYIMDDAQVADFNADMLSSIANAKPISGLTQNLTRANTRKLAQNRGHGWEQQYAATLAGTQILMIVEYGSMNSQSVIGQGVTNKTDDGSTNMAELTGATVNLGNASGEAETAGGFRQNTYRGEEGLWGNIWDWLDGSNIQNPSTFASGDGQFGTVFVADHDFADNTGAAPYEDTGIRVPYGSGYISAFGYSEKFDYLFIPVEFAGNSSMPVGDYSYNTQPGWHVAISGATWDYGLYAGIFCLGLYDSSTHRNRIISGRSVYIPSRKEELDAA